MKFADVALAAGLVLGSLNASAAALGSIDLSSGSGGFVNTPIAGAFSDTATFTLTTQATLSGIFVSAVGGVQDVDFTSIVLTGPSGPVAAFALARPDPFETWTLSTGLLSAGVYTLTQSGINSAAIGSYAANIAVTPATAGPAGPKSLPTPAASLGLIDLSSGSGGFVNTPIAGAFSDTATFTLTTLSTLSGIFASAVSGSQDVDFTSIVLTGPSGPVAFALLDPDPFETWALSTGPLSPGVYTLTQTGINSAAIGTYVANLAVTPAGPAPAPLPEPATYALMLAALGAMHFVTQRRKALRRPA